MSKYVTREIEKPYVVKARTINVSGAIDKAVGSLAPKYGQTDELRSDLTGALEAEILESEKLFVEDGLPVETPAAEGQ